MILSDLERQYGETQLFSGGSSLPTLVPTTPTAIKFGMVTYLGKGEFVMGSDTHPSQGAVPQRAAILGVPDTYSHYDQFRRGNTYQEGRVLGGYPRPI